MYRANTQLYGVVAAYYSWLLCGYGQEGLVCKKGAERHRQHNG